MNRETFREYGSPLLSLFELSWEESSQTQSLLGGGEDALVQIGCD